MSFEPLRICHATIAAHGPLLMTLFVAGLTGSVTHCVGMCGPFVLSQTATLLDDKPLRQVSALTRLRGAALIPYHLGRMTTYIALGLLATEFSAAFRRMSWFGDLSAALLFVAGVFFLMSAFPALRLAAPNLSGIVPPRFSAALRRLFANPRGARGYFLGLALGLLPCGLVYAAILSVAASGQLLTAAIGMIVFALGTVPSLVAVGVGGHIAFHRFPSGLRYVFPALMIINSLALFVMAGELLR
jgi:hypothetical protein